MPTIKPTSYLGRNNSDALAVDRDGNVIEVIPPKTRNTDSDRTTMIRVRCDCCRFITMMQPKDFVNHTEACIHCKSLAFSKIGSEDSNPEGWFKKK